MREFLNREQLFTGDVSHELRTPLTVLQGRVEILEGRLSGDDKLLPIVGRMQRTVASMTAMVGTMLLLARKPEQLEFRPFDRVCWRGGRRWRSGALAREACHLFQSVARPSDGFGKP